MIRGDLLARELPNDRKIQVLRPGAIIIALSESLECDDSVHFGDSSIARGGTLSAHEARRIADSIAVMNFIVGSSKPLRFPLSSRRWFLR